MPGLHVVGWLEPPSLDRATNSVSWAIESSDDNGQPAINSMALIFGRDGFEKLIWRGKAMFRSTNLLKIGQSSFSFPAGLRYADYEMGDRFSEFGVTYTIAAVLGMKRPTQR